MTFLPQILVVGLALVLRVAAQPASIAEAEALQAPTATRLAGLQTAAKVSGWAPQVAALRAAALLAYQRDKLAPAEAWYHVYRWAALFGESEASFVPRWIRAVEDAKVAHPNMPQSFTAPNRPLGLALAPELQAWLLGNPAFSNEFFEQLSPVDYVPAVFQILDGLYRTDPVRFRTYANLALAIAVVFDVPPPPDWPHGQVSTAALPRKLPAPGAAFAWWTKQDQLGHGYHRLTRLRAGELKFVVDAAAPFNELEWVAQVSDYPLNQLARAYTMVRYRTDRVANNNPNWMGKTYRLSDILAAGGICCDQAYFATQVGKSRGVPTLLFYGAGNDGRHAWFGFLDGNQKWQLDAGRYAEQRFVTGHARDPQTWRELSDHELGFLSERFRDLPSFRQSRVHADFAAHYLGAGFVAAAAAAARKAVNFERRNQPAWDTLIAAGQKSGRDAKTVESVMREAAIAFQRHPDLEARYVNRTADSLRARGETSLAAAEVSRIAKNNRSKRGDLSVQQARDTLLRAFATQTLPEQVKAYNTLLDTSGRGAGIGFFDQVVIVFAEHMLQLQQPAEAVRAVERARRTLKVEPDSQLEKELAKLLKELKSVK
jgi:hypothetical protein